MGVTFNTDTRIEEYFAGPQKILTHDLKTNQVTYHALPIKQIDVYAAYETTDEYGRLGRCIGFFSSETYATAQALGKGWYGSLGTVKHFIALEITNGDKTEVWVLKDSIKEPVDLDLVEKQKEEEFRVETLAKASLILTDDERRVLGIK